jgi:hypothetical protein
MGGNGMEAWCLWKKRCGSEPRDIINLQPGSGAGGVSTVLVYYKTCTSLLLHHFIYDGRKNGNPPDF